jgi:hypothetical protein
MVEEVRGGRKGWAWKGRRREASVVGRKGCREGEGVVVRYREGA